MIHEVLPTDKVDKPQSPADMLSEYQDLWDIYDIYAQLPEQYSSTPSSKLPTTPPLCEEPESPTKDTETLISKKAGQKNTNSSSGESTVVYSPVPPSTHRSPFFNKDGRFSAVAFHDKRKPLESPKQKVKGNAPTHATHLWGGLRGAIPLFRKQASKKETEVNSTITAAETSFTSMNISEAHEKSPDKVTEENSSSVYNDDPTSEEQVEEGSVEMQSVVQEHGGIMDKDSIQTYTYI